MFFHSEIYDGEQNRLMWYSILSSGSIGELIGKIFASTMFIQANDMCWSDAITGLKNRVPELRLYDHSRENGARETPNVLLTATSRLFF